MDLPLEYLDPGAMIAITGNWLVDPLFASIPQGKGIDLVQTVVRVLGHVKGKAAETIRHGVEEPALKAARAAAAAAKAAKAKAPADPAAPPHS